MMMAKTIIFTDLDGTLLHPQTYSFDAAMPALKLIKEKNIPLIFCSSKTRAEIEVWRKKLDNVHPFISENGGGIFVPEMYFGFRISDFGIKRTEITTLSAFANKYETVVTGKPYEDIRNAFVKLRNKFKVSARGFGDMSVKEIAALAGLTLTEARLAKQREFDEPFMFEDNPPLPLGTDFIRSAGGGRTVPKGGMGKVEEFLKAIEDSGLHWNQGRFYHILGDNDKGKAVTMLKEFYKKAYGRIKTIGLGDKFNDLSLLQEVDYPVLVQDEKGSYDTRVNMPNLITGDGIGPEGWNKEVIKLIGIGVT